MPRAKKTLAKREAKTRKSPYLTKLRKEIQLERAITYFKKRERGWKLMSEIVNRTETKTISLRALEFFCVKMSKDKSIMVENGSRPIPINKEYENCLYTHKKKGFDSFRRKGKEKDSLVEISLHGETLETNVAQLNFFMLMDSAGILQLAVSRSAEISEEMSLHQGKQ